jgi:hypothetical protein
MTQRIVLTAPFLQIEVLAHRCIHFIGLKSFHHHLAQASSFSLGTDILAVQGSLSFESSKCFGEDSGMTDLMFKNIIITLFANTKPKMKKRPKNTSGEKLLVLLQTS